MKKHAAAFFLLLGGILAVTQTADAKQGFYLGVQVPYTTIGGDFQGDSGLTGGNEVIILPEIDGAFGFGMEAGFGFTDHWAIQLSLSGSRHNGTWMGSDVNVNCLTFNINGKYSFLPSEDMQPYLLFGPSGNTLVIKDGARDTVTGEIGDATLSGIGLSLGGGVDQYIGQNLSLSLGMIFRIVDYTSAEGLHQSGQIDNSLDGSGISIVMSADYHF